MKKIILSLFILFLPVTTFLADTTDKLLIDMTINDDGSVLVKELATLEGYYNGRLRNYDIINPDAIQFSNQLSDLSGSSIYNAKNIYDIKVGDISSRNLSLDSFNKVTNFYNKTYSSNYDYGYYNLEETYTGIKLKIYNNTKTAFYIEYKMDDVVVTHEDISEFAWNILGFDYEENINTLEVKINLPKEDPDLRVWLHGTIDAYGEIKKIDNKTAYVIYENLPSNEPVSVRLMFNNNVVKNNKKKTELVARDEILRLQQQLANEANALREERLKELESQIELDLTYLEKNPTNLGYIDVMNDIKLLKDSDTKLSFLKRMDVLYVLLNKQTVKELDKKIDFLSKYLYKRDYLETENLALIMLDKNLSKEYLEKLEPLWEQVELKQEQRAKVMNLLIIIFIIICIYLPIKLKKDNLELSNFYIDYFREFPSDDELPLVEYLMTQEISTNSFSSIILDLIYKDVINIDPLPKNNYQLTLKDSSNLRDSEQFVVNVLFNIIGSNNTTTLNEVTKFGNTTKNAKILTKEFDTFFERNKTSAKSKKYFKYNASLRLRYLIILLLISVSFGMYSMFHMLSRGLFLLVPFLISGISLFAIKLRTKVGVDLYKKWEAHKKFLNDFGTFDVKELPEVKLWEKYLVYATLFGVAKKLQKQMSIKLKELELTDPYIVSTMNRRIMLDNSMSKAIQDSVKNSYSTAQTKLSPSSSGSGFGGGSMGGGGSFGGGSGGGRF